MRVDQLGEGLNVCQLVDPKKKKNPYFFMIIVFLMQPNGFFLLLTIGPVYIRFRVFILFRT